MRRWPSRVLLKSVLAQPTKQPISALNILPKAERQLVLADFNDNKGSFSLDTTAVALFEAQVLKTPDLLAVIFDADGKERATLTYRQLNEKANQVAHFLREKYDIRADDVIALQLHRSEWMIVAIMGVLKSGAAYLPIGTDYPKPRVEFMLEDARAKLLLTDAKTWPTAQDLHDRWPIECVEQINDKRGENPNNPISNRDLAYIVYTSGSTGTPKGVMTEHISVVNFVQKPIEIYQTTPADRVLQFSTYTFDTSVFEIFMAFFTGAALLFLEIRNGRFVFSLSAK